MKKFKSGDDVVVIAGKDKGVRGQITKVIEDPKRGTLYAVSGVNRLKKHQKPNPNAGIQGGIIEIEAPIAASNVAILNNETNKADRVGFMIKEDGSKVRIYKSTQKEIGA